jgi:tetratricopeptide (TPR) repeat protein
LLHQARLDHSALRARWWNLKGSALWDRSDARQERVAAFASAIALFADTAPQDTDYPTALNNRAVEAASAGQWNDAVAFYKRALAVYDSSKERDDAIIGGVKIMYGIALQQIGQFDAAERSYSEAASLALRTSGNQEGIYWQAVANHAVLVHALGARERADQMFVNLLPHIPDNYSASSDNAYVYEYYGDCLAVEGRANEGIVFLERAEKIFRERPMDEYDLPRVQRRLGNAYDRAGRVEDARRTLKAAYDKRVASSAPDLDNLLDVRERWGRFLLAHGNPPDAGSEFNTVLREAHGRSLAPIALAHGGLAILAIRARNAELALHESDLAVGVLDNVKGLYDVRLYPYLWLIRARALLLSGNASAARMETQRALNRSRELDAPSSSAIQEALGLVTATSGSAGKDLT